MQTFFNSFTDTFSNFFEEQVSEQKYQIAFSDVVAQYQRVDLVLVKQIGKKNQEATGEKLSIFSIPKYINGNTTRQTSLRYGLHKNTSSGLEGLFNFQVHEAEVL